ncbi:MAG: hypothetical protein IKT78_05215 [Ruminiclostridium sp.]|nr:hypothetical protein [Ruminiclostridium sp.]
MKKSFFKNPISLMTLAIPPVIVAAILLTVYALCGMYPFGDKTLAWCDMHQQVVPLLLNFKDILEGKGNFFLNVEKRLERTEQTAFRHKNEHRMRKIVYVILAIALAAVMGVSMGV